MENITEPKRPKVKVYQNCKVHYYIQSFFDALGRRVSGVAHILYDKYTHKYPHTQVSQFILSLLVVEFASVFPKMFLFDLYWYFKQNQMLQCSQKCFCLTYIGILNRIK